jgi:hypothetical protein
VRVAARRAGVTIALLAPLLCTDIAVGQGGDALQRYTPVLRYDNSEEYFAQPVSLPAGTAAVRNGDVVYGHVAVQDGEKWLQYWMFYAYNSQDRGILTTAFTRETGRWCRCASGVAATLTG